MLNWLRPQPRRSQSFSDDVKRIHELLEPAVLRAAESAGSSTALALALLAHAESCVRSAMDRGELTADEARDLLEKQVNQYRVARPRR